MMKRRLRSTTHIYYKRFQSFFHQNPIWTCNHVFVVEMRTHNHLTVQCWRRAVVLTVVRPRPPVCSNYVASVAPTVTGCDQIGVFFPAPVHKLSCEPQRASFPLCIECAGPGGCNVSATEVRRRRNSTELIISCLSCIETVRWRLNSTVLHCPPSFGFYGHNFAFQSHGLRWCCLSSSNCFQHQALCSPSGWRKILYKMKWLLMWLLCKCPVRCCSTTSRHSFVAIEQHWPVFTTLVHWFHCYSYSLAHIGQWLKPELDKAHSFKTWVTVQILLLRYHTNTSESCLVRFLFEFRNTSVFKSTFTEPYNKGQDPQSVPETWTTARAERKKSTLRIKL